MTDFYVKLMEKSGFDEALIRHALDFVKTIDVDEFSRLFFDSQGFCVEKTGVLCFDEAFYPYMFYDSLKTVNLPYETSSLYLYIAFLERSFEGFMSRIKNEDIFFDTAKRISDGAKEFRKCVGSYGLFDYRFVANHVRGGILCLGGFEYQYGLYDENKCIVIHVPDGADLTKEKRLNSYKLARQYFGSYPIIGDSWLLYGEHKKMLPEDSRIVAFMDDFDIVSTHETMDYSELFHVFGRLSDYSYENLPKETSLQRAYAEKVRNNQPIGSATGILKH